MVDSEEKLFLFSLAVIAALRVVDSLWNARRIALVCRLAKYAAALCIAAVLSVPFYEYLHIKVFGHHYHGGVESCAIFCLVYGALLYGIGVPSHRRPPRQLQFWWQAGFGASGLLGGVALALLAMKADFFKLAGVSLGILFLILLEAMFRFGVKRLYIVGVAWCALGLLQLNNVEAIGYGIRVYPGYYPTVLWFTLGVLLVVSDILAVASAKRELSRAERQAPSPAEGAGTS